MGSSGNPRKGNTGSTGPAATLGEWKEIELGITISNTSSKLKCSKDSVGFVYLRGAIESAGALFINSLIATLPENYRPAVKQEFLANLGGTLGNYIINTNGKIEINMAVGLKSVFIFDGIAFPLI